LYNPPQMAKTYVRVILIEAVVILALWVFARAFT
jgi:hypothetical protein